MDGNCHAAVGACLAVILLMTGISAPAAEPAGLAGAGTQSATASLFAQSMGQRIESFAAGNHGTETGEPGLAGIMGRMVFGLACVIALGLGLAWVWKRIAGGPLKLRPAGLRVLSRLQLSPRSSVYIIEALDRILVVSEHTSGTRTLCEISDPAQVDAARTQLSAHPHAPEHSFATVLRGHTTSDDSRHTHSGGSPQ